MRDASVKNMLIFAKTHRITELYIQGNNPMTIQLRQDLNNYIQEVMKIDNLDKGFVTAQPPIYI